MTTDGGELKEFLFQVRLVSEVLLQRLLTREQLQLLQLERFSFGCRKVIGFVLLRYTIG